MTISFLTKAAGNANLDLVFDPYVQGTSPPATGLLDNSGVDIASNRYAPIVYGSAAAATGLLTKQPGNADINTLFAAYGTANYPLPINGATYSVFGTLVSNASSASIAFFASTSAYRVHTAASGSVPADVATGPIPAGAVSMQITDTWTNPGGGDTGSGTVTNSAASITSLTSSEIGVSVSISATGSSPEHNTTHSEVITFYNASGSAISTTTITFSVAAAGGV